MRGLDLLPLSCARDAGSFSGPVFSKFKLLPRDLTSRVSLVLDNVLPPVLRDSRLVMSPLFRLAYGAKLAEQVMDFKDSAHALSPAAYASLYEAYSRCALGRRHTDLNVATLGRISELVLGTTVLDAGCGRGALVSHLRRAHPGLHLTGTDVVLPDASVRAADVQWVEGNVESLPFADGSFDTVLCTHTLEHVQDLPSALRELRRLPRKRLVVVLPRQRPYRYSFDLHLRFYPYRHSLDADFPPGRCSVELVDGDWLIVEDQLAEP